MTPFTSRIAHLALAGYLALMIASPERIFAVTPEDVEKLTPLLQAKVADLPEAPVNTERKEGTFTKLDLSKTATEVNDLTFYAFRFKVPAEGGELIWAFKYPEWSEGWQILAAKGSMKGFSRFHQRTLAKDVEGVGKRFDDMFEQDLGKENLTPGEEYIIWFVGSENKATPELILSVNVVQNISRDELFPMLR